MMPRALRKFDSSSGALERLRVHNTYTHPNTYTTKQTHQVRPQERRFYVSRDVVRPFVDVLERSCGVITTWRGMCHMHRYYPIDWSVPPLIHSVVHQPSSAHFSFTIRFSAVSISDRTSGSAFSLIVRLARFCVGRVSQSLPHRVVPFPSIGAL